MSSDPVYSSKCDEEITQRKYDGSSGHMWAFELNTLGMRDRHLFHDRIHGADYRLPGLSQSHVPYPSAPMQEAGRSCVRTTCPAVCAGGSSCLSLSTMHFLIVPRCCCPIYQGADLVMRRQRMLLRQAVFPGCEFAGTELKFSLMFPSRRWLPAAVNLGGGDT